VSDECDPDRRERGAPVRVCQVITRFIVGGAQEQVLLTVAALGGASPRTSHPDSVPCSASRPAVGPEFCSKLICGPETGPEGSLFEEAGKLGVQPQVLPDLVREIRPARDLRAFVELRRRFREADGSPAFDIVHTHSSKAGILGRLAARWAGIPIVVHTVHGWGFGDHQPAPVRRFYVELERFCARRTDALITVATQDRDAGLAAGIGTPERYHLIRSGIELERFGRLAGCAAREALRESFGIPREALVVGNVGRLSEQKAPLDLLRTFAEVLRGRPESWLILVGDGPLRPEVERAALRLGVQGRTILAGLRRDVPEILSTFDVFVSSARWEGLPRTLPQAMAAGLPVVATEVGGVGDAIRDGENGFLVPPGNPGALAQCVLRLLEAPALRERMGVEGRRRAPEFGADRMIAGVSALYRHLLRRRREASPGRPPGRRAGS
jgi:glycosyltransferase involved in cell wall biosynthesis